MCYMKISNRLIDFRLESRDARPQFDHKPEMLRELSEPGKLLEKSGNSVQPQAKMVTDKIFHQMRFLGGKMLRNTFAAKAPPQSPLRSAKVDYHY